MRPVLALAGSELLLLTTGDSLILVPAHTLSSPQTKQHDLETPPKMHRNADSLRLETQLPAGPALF